MTVGIGLTNGIDTVVMTDARASGSGRQTDSANKLSDFSNKNHQGVVFGTGDGNYLNAIRKMVPKIDTDTLSEFVGDLWNFYVEMLNDSEKKYLNGEKRRILNKANMLNTSEEQDIFFKNAVTQLFDKYDQTREQSQTSFVVAGYDGQSDESKLFFAYDSKVYELHLPHIEIGSGSDAANLYMGKRLQGLDTSKLSIADLIFFVGSAYAESTINQGVGGTPHLAIVSKDNVESVSSEKTIAIANITAAYSAEIINRKLTEQFVNEVIYSDNLNFPKIANKLGLASNNLTKLYIPFSSFQEQVNRSRK